MADDFDSFQDDDFGGGGDGGFNFGNEGFDEPLNLDGPSGSSSSGVGGTYKTNDDDEDLFSDDDDIDLDDTSGTMVSTGSSTEDEDNKNKIKRVAFFGLALALVLVVAICIVVKIAAGVKAKDTEKVDKKANAQVEQSYDTQTTDGNANNTIGITGSTGWVEITDNAWTFDDAKQEGTLSVTSVKTYANYNTSAGEAQLKTVVNGGVSGLAGTYEVNLPVELSGLVKVGTKLEVEYNMTQDANGDIIIGNMNVKE